MLQYLEERGLPSAEAMSRARLSAVLPPQPDQRVSGSEIERLWTVAVSHLNDPCCGMHMAESYNPGTLDILGYVLLSCPTIGDVFDRLSRYVRVLNDGLRTDITHEAREVHVRASFVTNADNYLMRRPREAMDSLWTGLSRELGRMTALPLRATRVWFAYPKPSATERKEYARVFDCPVEFDAPEYRVTVNREVLETPLRSANPALLKLFSSHADQVLARLDTPVGVSGKVLALIAARMTGRVPSVVEVARELAMSERNLQRALRTEGTTYQELVDAIRRDLAISHLKSPGTSASQVGFLLGFSEPSAFHRAFRRWTGQAPSEYRAN